MLGEPGRESQLGRVTYAFMQWQRLTTTQQRMSAFQLLKR